ncbi:Metallo-beta-lactamase [Cinara cedri]|uniref:Metallo-beta-lactamase n=1 Tax=Cinara cedri TaxID=506608 RepID=A0A5E4N582_9HEMI|nr:Metallo-beta-lactamase [Cinara cedri]
MGNPSDHVETPLTGGYLLIVLAEPRSAEHKLAILKKLTKGLLCWNFEESDVDIATELKAIVNQNIEGEEGKNGEQLFQYASDNLVAEILINPQHGTLVQCVRNLLASFTKYRCIIYTGYSFTENGSWILQDGTFSVADFLDAYKTAEAQRTIRLHENQIRIELHCSADTDWTQASRVKGTRFVLNPPEKIVENESIESLVRWLCDKIEVVELDTLLEGSQVVGNIRFSRPTLYVFPAGQGDSALFGINGFNMLIDGGAGRNSCFWGFARHLDRLDAVLLTRLNSTNLEGIASFLKRKTMSSLYPQIGHFFCNFKTRKQISSPNIEVKEDVLSISLIDTAQSLISDLKQLQLRPHLCYRNINLEPINLYHKVGHGKLDMYVLNPSKDSKEVKDFLTKWNEGDQKLFNPSKDVQFPLPNIISICTLLVWQPANPNTTITRILFPGSSPQNKIFEALERVKHLEFLKHPSCSIKSMSSSTSVTIKSQTTKKTVLEKMIPGETKTIKTMENLEVSAAASNDIIQTAIIPTVPKEGTPKPKSPVEVEKTKTLIKSTVKESINVKPKIEQKYGSITAKVNSNKVIQKSTIMKKPLKLSSKSPPTDKSSPTTPIENQEKIKPIKQVIKPKSTSSTTKSPSSTPSKSKKDEANRKVLVSSRTNSGLRRTQTTKRETKPPVLKNAVELSETASKKDSNVVYKSSLISGSKDKSGEEEDILIIEKVAISPDKLLTPDGKKIVANELDGILTTAKHMITKEKCAEKLSDSGATTAPTMPEDENTTEFKKEISANEYSDKKVEEFKKTKDSLKTPDEVADLPFHEEVDEQKTKFEEKKEIETVAETQEIVQVENAEYVLVSSDSSPEVLKRQVLDTVNLLDNEPDEDSDREDVCEETKETKLIEHLLESTKELSEITEKIDELKKQNEYETIKLESTEQKEGNNKHAQSKELKSIKEDLEEVMEKTILTPTPASQDVIGNEANTTETIVTSRSGSVSHEYESTHKTSVETQESKHSSEAGSLREEPEKSPIHDTASTDTIVKSRSCSISQEQEITHTTSVDKPESKHSSKAGSLCDEHIISPIHDAASTDTIIKSRSGSIGQEHESTHKPSVDKQESKESSKAGSICEEPVKSPIHEAVSIDTIVKSRSGSVSQERGITHTTSVDKLESKHSSEVGSKCDEPEKSPIHDTASTDTIITSRSGSVSQDQEITLKTSVEKQESKEINTADSKFEENVKSPIHDAASTDTIVKSRSGSVSQERGITHTTSVDKLESKHSSEVGSKCDEPEKSPIHDTASTDTIITSRSGSVSQDQDITLKTSVEKPESRHSSKASSLSEEPMKSPIHDAALADTIVKSRSGSVSQDQEITLKTSVEKQESKEINTADSKFEENVKSPIHDAASTDNIVKSRSGSVSQEQESTNKTSVEKQESKEISTAGSKCEEPVKSPIHDAASTDTIVTSRSGSVSQDQEITLKTSVEKQESKEINTADSKFEENVKSPIHDAASTDTIVKSRSDSVSQEHESIHKPSVDKHESKESSKAGSLCEEPVKSPIHDAASTDTIVKSRSGSVSQEHESTHKPFVDKQESKESSKTASLSEEPMKSPIHDAAFADTIVKSRSGSVSQEHESTHKPSVDKQESKASSKASSLCEEPVKSPIHDAASTDTIVKSRSGSVSQEHESTHKPFVDKQESKESSKTASLSEKPVKSPIHDAASTDTIVTSRSGSVSQDQEITLKTSVEKQESKEINTADSKFEENAGSLCEEPIISPIHDAASTDTIVKSRSGSVSQEHESTNKTSVEKQESKEISTAGSKCEEPVKSPIHDAASTDTIVKSRSGSVSQDQEITLKTSVEKQESKEINTADSKFEENVKSPIHDAASTDTIVKSRSDSVSQEHESIHKPSVDKHESKESSKAGSLCEEPVKSPILEAGLTDNIIKSRSGSVSQEQESTHKTSAEKQDTTKAGSLSEDPVKSPIHDAVTTDTIVKSQSDSVSQEQEIKHTTSVDKPESKESSKAGSICEEPIKSPIHDAATTDTILKSRSDSDSQEHVSIHKPSVDKHESKESSKAGSLCEEPVKSPIHDAASTDTIVKSRSGSVSQEQESTHKTSVEKQDTTKAGSLSEDPVKSPIHDAAATDTIVQSRSGSVSQEKESTHTTSFEKQGTTKPGSFDDENVKSTIHDEATTHTIVKSRSGSVSQEHEIIHTTSVDKPETKHSSKASSLSEEPIKSPIHDAALTDTIVKSRSGSVSQEHESTKKTSVGKQESKEINTADSKFEENVKSPIHDAASTDIIVKSRSASTDTIVKSRSGSVSQDQEITLKTSAEKPKSTHSSKAGSLSEEPMKSPIHDAAFADTIVKSRSGSVSQEHESTHKLSVDKQESKESSKAGSLCEEPIISPIHDAASTDTIIKSRSGSVSQDQEIALKTSVEKPESKHSSKTVCLTEEPVKSPIHDAVSTDTIITSRSGSVSQDQDITLKTSVEIQESKEISTAGSKYEEPIKSLIHEAATADTIVKSRSGSVSQEHEIKHTTSVDKPESNHSSKACSLSEEPVKSPIHDTASTDTIVKSRSGSVSQDHESTNKTSVEKQESKEISTAGSKCEEPVKSPIHDAASTDTIVKSRSGSVSQEHESTNKTSVEKPESRHSSKAGSLSEESMKSPIHDTALADTIVKSRSGSVSQDQEITLKTSVEKQESKEINTADSKFEENVKSPIHDAASTDTIVKSRSGSVSQEHESTHKPSVDKQESKEISTAGSKCEEPVKSLIHDAASTDTIAKSGSGSVSLDLEGTYTVTTDTQETKASSKADSVSEEPVKSPTHKTVNTIGKTATTITEADKPCSETSCTKESFCHDNTESSVVSNGTKSIFSEQENKETVLSCGTEKTLPDKHDSKISTKAHSVGGETPDLEINSKINIISSRSNSVGYDSEKQKSPSPGRISSPVFEESQKISVEQNKSIFSTLSDNITNSSDSVEKRVEEVSKPLGRIGSMCDEIAKFLTDDDKKTSKMIVPESVLGSASEFITHQSNIEESKIHSETIFKSDDNINSLTSVKNACILSNNSISSENDVKNALQLETKVQIDAKNDNVNKLNKDDCLPITNISVSNIKSPNISIPLIEETDKTGKMNVAQMIEKHIDDKSSTKKIVIEAVESKDLKGDHLLLNKTSDEYISKPSTVLIEHAVKTCDEKNIDDDCNSTVSTIGGKQSLGIILNSDDLGVTNDIVMQLKRDVHETLHQFSSEYIIPFTPQSEPSISRSAMNVDDDDDDEDDRNETDDDVPGSPMSTGPSPVPMQLDNRHVEMNIDFNKALQEHRTTRGEDLTTTETNGNHVTETKTTDHDNINRNQGTSSDTVQSWGKPLGLPPVQSINNNGFDPIREWGKPLGLPSPTQPVHDLAETQTLSSKTTPKKNVKKAVDNKPIMNIMDKDGQNRIRRSESPSKLRSRSSSRMSRINPVYLDLIYVPHHGNSKYISADFFKRIRARNYVFSGTDPSKEVLNALIEGKQAWEDQDLEVTIIPTYDTDTLSQWVAENEDLLAKLKIDLSPSASRCTIKLQDHNTSCSAYRLEF